MNTQKPGLIGFALLLLAACTPVPPRDLDFAPAPPASLPPVQSSGSIYQSAYDISLFQDNKAMRVGDVLTITFNELTQATKKGDLSSNKSDQISFTAPSLYGMAVSTMTGSDLSTKISSKNQFTGAGAADQSNSLTGDISVTVVELLPNGSLKVRGEKRVTLNQGNEYIRLSGIVRTVDIDTANTVSSDKVADATIMYTGDGAMADASKMGWLARFINSPWYPF
ncbi:MAG: flagellar basal body L-ring protein FlgH [Methylococcales bacterium]|nr:flagellar basal body L-ring protein FlgH [Methylococcales bacterium]